MAVAVNPTSLKTGELLETCHVGVFVVWTHWGLMGFLIAGSHTYPNAAQTL